MSEKINVNVADAETLTSLTGIGPVLAERIIEYRETVHPFEEVIELAAVPGISEKMVRGFESEVMVQVETADRTTAVPPNLDEPEDILLLDAPEEPELLAAPDQQPENIPMAEPPEEELVAAEPDSQSEGDELAEAQPDPANAEESDSMATAVSEPPPPAPEPALAEAPPSPPPAAWEATAQRRGCLNSLIGATFGAILGAVLTLAILAALNNGSLSFAASDTEIRQQLDTEIISRTNELNQISTRLSLVATEEAAANQALQTELVTANEALSEEIANNEEIISYLATRSGDLELRLAEVAGAADTFTGFLDGLRLLLDDLEGGSATATPAAVEATVSPTPSPTPFSTNTPPATPTTAVLPTRTPQPTATPFTFPTNTPAPQP